MYTQLYERVSRSLSHLDGTFGGKLFYWILVYIGFETYRKLLFFLFLQISFGWSTVKIDMSAVHQFQPIMPFSVPAFAATLFALGLALGTTIAVGMLFFIQVRDLHKIPHLIFPS